jgi:hypothetical protein
MKNFTEMLKGNQHKIDKNKNGKVDAHDFKLLRKEEKMCEHCDMPKSECKCEHEMKEAKHVIGVTVSDPNHTMVSQRNEKKMRKAKVSAVDKDTAINTAISYYKKRGMKVHDHNYIGLHNEETKTNDVPFDGPYTTTFKKKNNPNRSPMDAARALAQQGMKKKMKEEFDIDITDEQADSLIEMSYAPVAPVPDKKYIKGTPENKALKAARKPINGMPTGKIKEEVELEEATVDTKKYSWGTMKTIHQGSSFNIPLHPEHHQAIAKLKDQQEHKFKTEDGKHYTAKRDGDKVHFQGANNGNKTSVAHSTMQEGVELEEANHREFASQGKMHPDMAKHMKTGEHMDYYEPKTGDKVHGKVMKNDGKEVHVKQTHDSYDPKKVGAVHKFVVSNKLDESNLNSQKEENQLKKFKQFKEEIYDKLSSNEESIEEQVDDLDEMEFDKSGKYVNKGKYGTSYQGDDEEDDDKPKKPAPAGEKRGRGRPAGSMSGAKQKGSGPAKKRSGVEYTGFKLHLPNNNR